MNSNGRRTLQRELNRQRMEQWVRLREQKNLERRILEATRPPSPPRLQKGQNPRARQRPPSNFDALEDLINWAKDEGAINEPAPISVRLIIRNMMPRLANLSPSMRCRLVKSVAFAPKTLTNQQGTQAAKVIPHIVQSVQKTAQKHRLPVQALPQAIRRIAARVANSPSVVNRLSRQTEIAEPFLDEVNAHGRLLPPNDCAQHRHNLLQRQVNQACDRTPHGVADESGARQRRCTPDLNLRGCSALSQRVKLNIQCVRDRRAINQECNRGGVLVI
jgi:hypothetical protein